MMEVFNTHDFIRTIINKDLSGGKHTNIVVRFPPEPNGFLHIGHAKSSTLNFGLAAEYGGRCHLRFDDTNPETEDQKYVESIKHDLKWLGFDWGEHEYYASDYFETLFEWACALIQKDLAYVDDSPEDVIKMMRGTVTTPGTSSVNRNRSSEENLDRFHAMRQGKFKDGSCVLRAKIDLSHPNMKMRDPLMYRIRHATHYRRGDQWCIYPFYDWAHGQSDAIEGVTHSICTLEFAPNRVLYDWYLDALEINPRPQQYEFARLNLEYTVTSKRKLLRLVEENIVDGWNDPRMPTLAGYRRRGVRSQAIRLFCESVGTTKVDSTHDPALLEHCIRDDLNHHAPRVHCVQDPLPLTLTNCSKDQVEYLSAPYWPHDVPRKGTRDIPFSRELLIERGDFSEHPPKGYRRLTPGGIVRLRHACIIRCTDVKKNEAGQVEHLFCERIHQPDGEKPRGTIHWVDATYSVPVTVRVHSRMFTEAVPDGELTDMLAPSSLTEYTQARIEPSVSNDAPDQRYQFVRLGYYWRDPQSPSIFHCIVPLRDSSSKTKKHSKTAAPKTDPPQTSQPVLTADEEEWLRKNQLSSAIGLAIYRVPGGRDFFEIASRSAPPTSVGNWMANHLLPTLGTNSLADLPFGPNKFAQLIQLSQHKKAGHHEIRTVLQSMFESDESPAELLTRVQDSIVQDPGTLKQVIGDVLKEYEDRVQAYANGKVGLLGFFVGQVMKQTKGKADPKQVQVLISEELSRITS